MATVEVNDTLCIKTLQNVTAPKLDDAAYYIAQEMSDELAASALRHGSEALYNRMVWDADYNSDDTAWGVVQDNVINVWVEYNQNNLIPEVGEDTETWRHTSPTGENPEDYRELVNSGNSGMLFGISPAWDGNGGFYTEVMEKIPEIVWECLLRAGITPSNSASLGNTAGAVISKGISKVLGFFKR